MYIFSVLTEDGRREIIVENSVISVSFVANLLENSKAVITFKVYSNTERLPQEIFGFGGFSKWEYKYNAAVTQ